MPTTTDIPQSVIDAVRAAIEAKIAPVQVERLTVKAGKDFDGDDSIFIDVWYAFSKQPIVTSDLLDAHSHATEVLRKSGEPTFAYVRAHFAAGQSLARAA